MKSCYCLVALTLILLSFLASYLSTHKPKRFCIGHGFDCHPFLSERGQQNLTSKRPLRLGGVDIECALPGLKGHSDSDVVIHALIDALLGATGLGDIGQYFPDTQIDLKNMDSRIMLRKIKAQLSNQNYAIGNIDITLMAHKPRLAPYRETMRYCLAEDLGLSRTQISIKFTTNNSLGFVGREEGIAASAIALVYTPS